nr:MULTISPECIES: fumarylacetoacetate hydrolase family protein [Ramlibacter]
MSGVSQNALHTLSEALLAARRAGPALDDAAYARHIGSADDAYAVQHAQLAALDGAGTVPRHWKSGGASREATLTHAPLPRAGVLASGADASQLGLRHLLVEAEIALRLARDVTAAQAAALSHGAVDGLVDAMCVSIEMVDSRWERYREAPALLKLADFQSHGALVLGEFVPYQARDWARQECRVRIGDCKWRLFTGTHSLGTPEWLLPIWLRHATAKTGATVPAGTVVTTGTWCGLLQARRGDVVEVGFDGVGEAKVRL